MSRIDWDAGSRSPRKTTIDRTVLRDQVREYLIDAILDGKYAAGDRIVETRVAQQLGISQGAVREALREMEWMGFLETQAYSGTYVKDLSIDELIELYPVRAVLESLGARLACPKLSDPQIDRLEVLIDDMVQVSEDGDARGMVERNFVFHQLIIEASNNATLIRFWSMFQFSYWTQISTTALQDELVYLARRHYPIIEAFVPAIRSYAPGRCMTILSSW